MNEMQVFSSEQFGQVRTTTINGEPWFVAADVCKALDISDASKAMDRLDDDEGGRIEIAHPQNPNKTITVNAVNESGLYELVLGSRKKEAKAFKRWIKHEVLPSIRKTGGYIVNEDKLSDDELIAKALIMAQDKIKQREERIKALEAGNAQLTAKVLEDKPKVRFAESVEASDTSILIGQLAKQLKQNGLDIGQKRLFERLRQEGFLCKAGGRQENLPTQRAMDMGLFEIKERAHTNPDGTVLITRTTLVSGKGQVFFTNRYLAEVAK